MDTPIPHSLLSMLTPARRKLENRVDGVVASPHIARFSRVPPLLCGQVDDTAVSLPSVYASSTVIYTGTTESLVVKGDNFEPGTRLIFDPPLDMGFKMRVRKCRTSRCSIDAGGALCLS